MINYLLARLAEPSTFRGIFMLVTAAGVTISPEQASAVMGFGMAAVGAVGVFTKDAK